MPGERQRMALTINTNISSLITQKNLSSATLKMNKAMERMVSGFKINHAKDNAAGYSIAGRWSSQISSLDMVSSNAAMGLDLLQTAEGNYSLISTHLQRIRDLSMQAANGTYGSMSLNAIRLEVESRLEEIDRVVGSAEFNGIDLMTANAKDINIQVGITSDESSRIVLKADLFQEAYASTLFGTTKAVFAANVANNDTASAQITLIDKAISIISDRVTNIGALQNQLESALESIEVQTSTITSSLSTIKDADMAEESSSYLQAQILQQASATLLATANQNPSIVLNLI